MMFSNQVLNQFSELDYEVYNFILKNSEKIPYMTIREFANEAHVSTTTITRFCRKVNCNGFSEFKIRFKMEQESTKTIRQGFDFSSILDFFQRIETESFHEQLKSIANIIAEIPKESIIIILSVEGETDVLIENSEIIKQSNSTVVSVTNSKNSTLARISDYNISYYIQGERTDYKKMKVDITSQIPAVYIVEALAKLTVQRKQG